MLWGYTFERAYSIMYDEIPFYTLNHLEKLMKLRFFYLRVNLLMLSDGILITHGNIRFQKSGSYTTLSANSAQRSILPILMADALSSVMGDDCVEESKDRTLEQIEAIYKEYGFLITDTKIIKDDDPVEFCSHMLYKDKAVPQNQFKMLFKYLHSPLRSTPEQIMQIKSDLRHAPDGQTIINYLSSTIEGWAKYNE